jgi:hypothetical protein
MHIRNELRERMSGPSLETLLKLFEFDKKRELERYCRITIISKSDFANLVLACDISGEPFLHRISFRDIVPEHLNLSDADHKALADNGVGPLGPEAAKAVRKMFQIFEERRYLVGHMFHNRDLSKWHFFCFDQRDLEERRPNHWKEGSHVHFMNWLWPNQDAKTVWSEFVSGNYKPGSSIHLRFSHEREASKNESSGPSA